MRPTSTLTIAAVLLALHALVAQAQAPDTTAKRDSVPPIQDNSFLIEEAYNQDAGVVQHISTFSRPTDGSGWAYSFTQEWPLFGMRHQLSYMIPVLDQSSAGASHVGIGDVLLNYRYQLVGMEGGRTAIAPRLSLSLPTGSASEGRGAGAAGLQVMLPLSLTLSPAWATHFDAGLTATPHAHAADGATASTVTYTLGHSVIWMASPRFNVLLETLWNRVQSVAAPGATSVEHQLLVSPGVRWSYNLPGDLQIVPGIAFPIGVGPSRGDRSVFLYLSFEHPFTH